MSKFTYYFPFLIGMILGPVIAYFKLAELWATASDGFRLLTIPCSLLAGVLLAVLLQLLLIAIQGVNAGVVPVFGGRSIRGGRAVAIGMLMLTCKSTGVATLLASRASGDVPAGLFWFVLILWLASLLGSIGTYLWCIPNAVRDFVDEPLKD